MCPQVIPTSVVQSASGYLAVDYVLTWTLGIQGEAG